jgi:hypothetical protein
MRLLLGVLAVSLVIMAIARVFSRWSSDTSELMIAINGHAIHLYGLQAEWAAFPFVMLCVWGAYRIVAPVL